MDHEFSIDHVSSDEVRGWVWLPGNSESQLTVELLHGDGRCVGNAVASEFRLDLAIAGKRAGWCAFRLMMGPELPSGSYEVVARHEDGGAFRLTRVDHENAQAKIDSALDPRLSDSQGAHGWLDTAGPYRFYGWLDGRASGQARRLELWAEGKPIATSAIDHWREDLMDIFQGDGRRGFSLPIPAAFTDGCEHTFDIRWEDGGESLLRRPITIVTAVEALPAPSEAKAIIRPPAQAPIELTVIVNFYNMPVEADRTLTSLSRAFQRDVEEIAYEVLCVDNGSKPAMTQEQVARHGPEFRLVQPARQHPSPVFALNEAAGMAQGRYLAVMIDGAHLLSPGVIAEAIAALREEKHAMVAVRHWFIGGDQWWLSTIGFQREQQQTLFARIDWPNCGYDIFKIASPIHDNPHDWFENMTESNCLILSKQDFEELGGFAEAFDIAGGGLANPDLFTRAAALTGMTVIGLIGEATFHQFHQGTTTNVTGIEKDKEVRRYTAAFEELRHEAFAAARSHEWKFRGVMPNHHALKMRQSPNSKVRIGLTSKVRPMPLSRSVDGEMRQYLSSAYVESGGPERTVWLGQPTGVAPADLVAIQNILWQRRPELLLMSGAPAGLVHFVRSLVAMPELNGSKLVWISDDVEGPDLPCVLRLVGTASDNTTQRQIEAAIGGAESICVLLQPTENNPFDEIHLHARYVSSGDYLVVLGTDFGQPNLGYSNRWISSAIRRFISTDRHFKIDETLETHVVSVCRGGFLQRVPDQADARYDESLDALDRYARDASLISTSSCGISDNCR